MTDEIKDSNPEAQPDTSNQLTINDLSAMKSIIDIASSRGAFKPNEMVIIGQTYNKLTTFLDSVKQQGETK